MLKDLRHAVRGLLRAKGWTAVVILSLALGIGANTAIFTGVNALLLTQIPVKDPDTLVRLRYGGPQRHGHQLERLRLLGQGRATARTSGRRSRSRCISSSSPTTRPCPT